MGCEWNFQKLEAVDDEAAIKEGYGLIAQAQYDHGHAGYTGSWAECRGVVMLEERVPDGGCAESFLEDLCQKWGPMLIVKAGDTYFAGALCSD